MAIREWSVHAMVIGGKHIGVYTAETGEEAIKLALADDAMHVSMCHQCSSECEDPNVSKLTAETQNAAGDWETVEEEL